MTMRLEAEGGAVDGGVADAEVVGEAAEEEALEAAFAEVSGEAGRGEVVVFEEGGVAVDVAAEAFAQDEFGVRDVERGVEGSAGSVLEAVFGPEGLRAVGDLDGFEGLLAGWRGGEGDVLGGVPVLGEDDVIELFGEGIDDGDYLSPSATARLPPGQKSFCTSMTRRASSDWRVIVMASLIVPLGQDYSC